MARVTHVVRVRASNPFIPSCPLLRLQFHPLKTHPLGSPILLGLCPQPRLTLCPWSYPDDGEQLVAVNTSIAIDVVELEVPAQLLFHLPLENEAERGHILHEVDVAVLGGGGARPP